MNSSFGGKIENLCILAAGKKTIDLLLCKKIENNLIYALHEISTTKRRFLVSEQRNTDRTLKNSNHILMLFSNYIKCHLNTVCTNCLVWR